MSEFIPEDLFAGEPVITARWRLSNRALPLKNRHLRAFSSSGVSNGLASWARQHIEWTLAEGAGEYPDGVLSIVVDEQGRAVMSIEPHEPLPAMTAAQMLERAADLASAPVEGEVVWACTPQGFVLAGSGQKPLSGANSLMADLARTLGSEVSFAPSAEALPAQGEVFLVSDEHGVVPSSDRTGDQAAKLDAYYCKLTALTRPDLYDRANLGIIG